MYSESRERVELNRTFDDENIPVGSSGVIPIQQCTVYSGSNQFFNGMVVHVHLVHGVWPMTLSHFLQKHNFPDQQGANQSGMCPNIVESPQHDQT